METSRIFIALQFHSDGRSGLTAIESKHDGNFRARVIMTHAMFYHQKNFGTPTAPGGPETIVFMDLTVFPVQFMKTTIERFRKSHPVIHPELKGRLGPLLVARFPQRSKLDPDGCTLIIAKLATLFADDSV